MLSLRLFIPQNIMNVEINYSLFSDTIAKQLKSKKILFDKEKVKLLQELSFQTMSLSFHELITKEQSTNVMGKIHKRLENHLSEHNAG